jgi:hypothetical protein
VYRHSIWVVKPKLCDEDHSIDQHLDDRLPLKGYHEAKAPPLHRVLIDMLPCVSLSIRASFLTSLPSSHVRNPTPASGHVTQGYSLQRHPGRDRLYPQGHQPAS